MEAATYANCGQLEYNVKHVNLNIFHPLIQHRTDGRRLPKVDISKQAPIVSGKLSNAIRVNLKQIPEHLHNFPMPF